MRILLRFTVRAFIIGIALAFFIGVAAPYGNMIIRGSYMALNISTPIAFFIFFVLVGGVNVALRLLRVRLGAAAGRTGAHLHYDDHRRYSPYQGLYRSLAAQDHGSLLLRYARERLATLAHPHIRDWLTPPRPGDDQVFF